MIQVLKAGSGLDPEPEDYGRETISLEEAQKIVGGYVEEIKLKHRRIMLVNEDGCLLNLAYNYRATMLIHTEFDGAISPIVGNAIVCNRNEFKIK